VYIDDKEFLILLCYLIGLLLSFGSFNELFLHTKDFTHAKKFFGTTFLLRGNFLNKFLCSKVSTYTCKYNKFLSKFQQTWC
jgi:hypothetical protein